MAAALTSPPALCPTQSGSRQLAAHSHPDRSARSSGYQARRRPPQSSMLTGGAQTGGGEQMAFENCRKYSATKSLLMKRYWGI